VILHTKQTGRRGGDFVARGQVAPGARRRARRAGGDGGRPGRGPRSHFLQGMPLYFIQSIVVHLDLDQVLV
jgi:hypothetical protein